MGAGKGWSKEETVLARKAFHSSSEDPRSGSGKKKDRFAAQVLEVYNTLLKDLAEQNRNITYHERTAEAVIQRFRKSKCECLKFEGIVRSIKSRDPTGSPTEEQIERAALAVYNGEATISQMYSFFNDRTKDAGPDFPFYDTLRYLRTTHTWDMILCSKHSRLPVIPSVIPESNPSTVADDPSKDQPKASPQASETRNEIVVPEQIESPRTSQPSSHAPTPTEVKRPTGTKRAVESAKQVIASHKGAEAIEKMAEAARKRAKFLRICWISTGRSP